jgi:hypothetical protein
VVIFGALVTLLLLYVVPLEIKKAVDKGTIAFTDIKIRNPTLSSFDFEASGTQSIS